MKWESPHWILPSDLCPNPCITSFIRVFLHKSHMSQQLWIPISVSSSQWGLLALLGLHPPVLQQQGTQGRKAKVFMRLSPHMLPVSQGWSCTVYSSIPNNSCPTYFIQFYSFWFWGKMERRKGCYQYSVIALHTNFKNISIINHYMYYLKKKWNQ